MIRRSAVTAATTVLSLVTLTAAAPAGEAPRDYVLSDRGVRTLAYSPSGRFLATAGEHGLRLWNAATGAGIRELTRGEIIAIAFAPDGRTIAGADRQDRIRLWNVADGTPAGEMTAPDGDLDALPSLIFSTGGRRPPHSPARAIARHGRAVAEGGWKTLRVTYPATGETRDLVGHGAEISSVAFAPDGRRLVSVGGFYDNTARLWDLRTGRQIRALCDQPDCSGYFSEVVFSPGGDAVAAVQPYSNEVRVWRV